MRLIRASRCFGENEYDILLSTHNCFLWLGDKYFAYSVLLFFFNFKICGLALCSRGQSAGSVFPLSFCVVSAYRFSVEIPRGLSGRGLPIELLTEESNKLFRLFSDAGLGIIFRGLRGFIFSALLLSSSPVRFPERLNDRRLRGSIFSELSEFEVSGLLSGKFAELRETGTRADFCLPEFLFTRVDMCANLGYARLFSWLEILIFGIRLISPYFACLFVRVPSLSNSMPDYRSSLQVFFQSFFLDLRILIFVRFWRLNVAFCLFDCAFYRPVSKNYAEFLSSTILRHVRRILGEGI